MRIFRHQWVIQKSFYTERNGPQMNAHNKNEQMKAEQQKKK